MNDDNLAPGDRPARTGYYRERLAASSLRQCYEIAPPRVHQYLRAEIDFVVRHIAGGDLVLDLGCGYGRELPAFADAAGFVVGIDTSAASLSLARTLLGELPNCLLAEMDATRLAFVDGSFDLVACIQNGASAFHVDLSALIGEALRVARPGGLVLLSTYADAFWEQRLRWFELQAQAGLIGPLDRERSRDGSIVCADGFTATTVCEAAVRAAIAGSDAGLDVVEVDESSLFFVLRKG